MTGIFKKSFAAVASAVIIVSVYIIAGVLLLSGAQYYEINTRNLEETVKTLGVLIPHTVFTEDESDWASRFGQSPAYSAAYRITLIRRNGQVVFDSEADSAEMENHLDRQEFQAAITGGIGSWRRKSATMGQEYIYAALGIRDALSINNEKGEIAGVLRISMPVPSFSSRLLSSAYPFLFGAFLLILGASAGLYRFLRSLSRSIEAKLDAELEKKTREIIKRTEEAEAEGRQSEAILNSMFEGVIALDKDLKIILVNPRLCSLFGIDNEKDWRGMSLLEFSRSAELEEAARLVLSKGRPFELTHRRYESGTEQHFQVFASPLGLSSNGAGEGVVIVLEDISRLFKLEQIRKDFVANVSHELRTPIQVVKGFAENLLNSLDNKEQIRRFAEIIGKNARTMENLTNDLLTLVSLEDESSNSLSSIRPPMEETLLAPLIAEAEDMVESAARKKSVTIETSCQPDLRVKLYGSLLVQALVNLLDNGIKYSDSGSCIKIRALKEGEQLIIEVKDKGIGIPAEHIGRIFERFYRVDRSRQRTEGSREEGIEPKAGTGLGLAIVRHIAMIHKGSAEVESHAGEGSVFRLRLPG